jgi:hypothetical protein
MKIYLLLAVAFVLCHDAVAQASIGKLWGKKGYDAISSAAPTSDGGYIMSGLTISHADTIDGDIMVIKVNAHADTMWSLHVGGPKLEGGNYVKEAADGGYLVCGHTENFGAHDCDAYLMKLDKEGRQLWLKVYGGEEDDIGNCVLELPDGGYIIAGITENFGAGRDERRDAWIVKTNAAGDQEWARNYGGPKREYAYSMVRLAQGGYLVAGFSSSYSSNGAENAWLLHLADNGDTISTKLYPSAGDSRFGRILPVDDGGFIVCGYTHTTTTGASQGFIVKLDQDGKEQWQKIYGSGTEDVAFYNAAKMPDGRLIFTGSSHKQSAEGMSYVLTTSATGVFISEQYLSGPKSIASAVAVQSNNSYLVAGIAYQSDPLGDAFYALRDEGLAGIPETHASMPMVFPNPASNTLSIVLPSSIASQSTTTVVSDIRGRVVANLSTEAGKDVLINCKPLAKGLYTYQTLSRNGNTYKGTFAVQ